MLAGGGGEAVAAGLLVRSVPPLFWLPLFERVAVREVVGLLLPPPVVMLPPPPPLDMDMVIDMDMGMDVEGPPGTMLLLLASTGPAPPLMVVWPEVLLDWPPTTPLLVGLPMVGIMVVEDPGALVDMVAPPPGVLWPGEPPLLEDAWPPFGVDAVLPGIEPPELPGVEAVGDEPGLEPPCEAGVETPPAAPLVVVEGDPLETGALVAGMLVIIDVGGIV